MKESKQKEMTIPEVSDYFDEHDIFESGDTRKVSDIKFRLQKKRYGAAPKCQSSILCK